MTGATEKPDGYGNRILVTGANGQLGRELQRLAIRYPHFEFYFLGREDLPIHHFEMVRHYFSVYKPAYVINTAAYTAVDRAEDERDRVFQINGEAPGVLAAICHQHQTKLIHISTDYVFDGTAREPYSEDAPTNPQSVYGASKLEGEIQIRQFNPEALIIRTSWVYSSYGKNFVRTMLKLMKEREEVTVVNDQVGSPTYAADLAEAILQIIDSRIWKPGIYHYCNEGAITWFEFAVAIRELTGNACRVKPIPTSAYPTPAKRPAYSVLDTTRIRDTYQIRLKEWKQSLENCLKELKD
ncbi:MAG: dTDP-4-dehydrorhamnose reductase [Chitinophagaceae bacterium]